MCDWKRGVYGKNQMIEIRYGRTELRLQEDVDSKALAAFLNALRRHD